MSPRGSVYPGRRAHLAPVTGVAGVLATAIAGIFLAFTNSAEPPAQSPPEFDQKSPLTPRSHSPSATPVPDQSDGSFQDLSWTQVVPSPGVPVPADPLASVEAVPSLDPGPPASVHGHPPLPPAPTPHRPAPRRPASVATPPPARTAPKRPAPPRNEVAVPPPASSPTPQAPPQARSAPEPDRRADPPPAISGGADPCATFHDFRREPCYAYLNRLTH